MFDYNTLNEGEKKVIDEKLNKEFKDPENGFMICDVHDGYRCAMCYWVHFDCICDDVKWLRRH